MDILTKSGKTVVYLSGEINASTGLKIKEELLSHLETHNAAIISFAKVTYMNSSGLREALAMLKQANSQKKQISLCCMNKDILELFTFTGLDRIFKIYTTEEEAISK